MDYQPLMIATPKRYFDIVDGQTHALQVPLASNIKLILKHSSIYILVSTCISIHFNCRKLTHEYTD